jgi:hypothetical protein
MILTHRNIKLNEVKNKRLNKKKNKDKKKQMIGL